MTHAYAFLDVEWQKHACQATACCSHLITTLTTAHMQCCSTALVLLCSVAGAHTC
jgi:hypothetical protein